jgi:hypothetical protein
MSSRPALPSEDRRVGGLSDAGHPQRPGPCPLPLEINWSQPDFGGLLPHGESPAARGHRCALWSSQLQNRTLRRGTRTAEASRPELQISRVTDTEG